MGIILLTAAVPHFSISTPAAIRNAYFTVSTKMSVLYCKSKNDFNCLGHHFYSVDISTNILRLHLS